MQPSRENRNFLYKNRPLGAFEGNPSYKSRLESRFSRLKSRNRRPVATSRIYFRGTSTSYFNHFREVLAATLLTLTHATSVSYAFS